MREVIWTLGYLLGPLVALVLGMAAAVIAIFRPAGRWGKRVAVSSLVVGFPALLWALWAYRANTIALQDPSTNQAAVIGPAILLSWAIRDLWLCAAANTVAIGVFIVLRVRNQGK